MVEPDRRALRAADELDAQVRAGARDDGARDELRRRLDNLARDVEGLTFRYIPAGAFDMGSERSEPDERPVHRVELSGFWMTDVPVSWADYCRLLGWSPPPEGLPPEGPDSDEPGNGPGFDKGRFYLYNGNKIRLQYCEDQTARAIDWHSHMPGETGTVGGRPVSLQKIFGAPPRDDSSAPFGYATKPMVSVSWHMTQDLGERLSDARTVVQLPTEAQWERAARGLHTSARYPWGDDPPREDLCDCDAFRQFRIYPSRALPANGYGLYAMSGGVWEWCRDGYDATFYRDSPVRDPHCPGGGERTEYVLRGGSWADCPEACTVSFRFSRPSPPPTAEYGVGPASPNIGFRLTLRPAD